MTFWNFEMKLVLPLNIFMVQNELCILHGNMVQTFNSIPSIY